MHLRPIAMLCTVTGLSTSICDNHFMLTIMRRLLQPLGTEVYVLRNEKNKLTIRAQVARGYRVPTLNDRYWIPGGNPDVVPEDAIHFEGGAELDEERLDSWHYTIDGSIL